VRLRAEGLLQGCHAGWAVAGSTGGGGLDLLPAAPVVVLDGQHQVTAAAAVLAGLTGMPAHPRQQEAR
jgi:hypothetical protein